MSEDQASVDRAPVIVDPAGQPARKSLNTSCPQCRAPKAKRVLSGNFGPDIHDVCGVCGHDFDERTIW